MNHYIAHVRCERSRRVPTHDRRGVALVLIVFMLFTFLITAAMTVDYAYMQLIRTELRAATDAAAKAGAEALLRTEDPQLARMEARRYAELNTVAGAPFAIELDDVSVGRVQAGNNGRWNFTPDANPANAVRVDGRISELARHKPIPLFFGSALGVNSFSTTHRATAGQQEVEVCLCLDRSGSMLFDMSGVDYSYPPNNPNLSTYTAWGTVWQNHLSPPHPTHSRWAVLARSVDLFFQEANGYVPAPRMSLVTWASTYQMPIAPHTQYQDSTTNVPLPALGNHNWSSNVASIQSVIQQLGSVPMMGATNLSSGLNRAVNVLTGNNSNSLANKVIILFTDGEWNEGSNPVQAAIQARDHGITIHCITMLTRVQPDIQQIADVTGGRAFFTNNEAEIRAAFEELARSLPVVLTE